MKYVTRLSKRGKEVTEFREVTSVIPNVLAENKDELAEVVLIDNKLRFMVQSTSYSDGGGVDLPIRFCPMCGKELTLFNAKKLVGK